VAWRASRLGVGAALVIAPAYIAEIAPASIRGRLGSLQQLAIVSGIFVVLLSDYLLATAAGGANNDLWLGLAAWRWMFITLIVPALAYGILAMQIPESPRYLMFRGRTEEARISTTFPALADINLGLAYGLYTTFAQLSFFFVFKFVPETKGK
jgi:MFS transporter, SP family, sugar:H+ symporter